MKNLVALTLEMIMAFMLISSTSMAGPNRTVVCESGDNKVTVQRAIGSPNLWLTYSVGEKQLALVACAPQTGTSSFWCANGVDDRYKANPFGYTAYVTCTASSNSNDEAQSIKVIINHYRASKSFTYCRYESL